MEEIKHNSISLALIVRRDYHEEGVHFLTPGNSSLQLACMNHPAGKIIQAHVHNPVERTVYFTKEVLVIKKGKLRVDFYSEAQQYLESRVLEAGDVILLLEGGHGFEVLEAVEMLEIKQGPYAGDKDKIRF
jgi:mannose-6-phosphate isomerase-like protein (cupin superfamily)